MFYLLTRVGKFLPPGGKKTFFNGKNCPGKNSFCLQKLVFANKNLPVGFCFTTQTFNDFLLIQMSPWKCVVFLVYCIVAIASSISTTDGV